MIIRIKLLPRSYAFLRLNLDLPEWILHHPAFMIGNETKTQRKFVKTRLVNCHWNVHIVALHCLTRLGWRIKDLISYLIFVNETNDIADLANCDGATEGRTDTTSYRDAEAHLKRGEKRKLGESRKEEERKKERRRRKGGEKKWSESASDWRQIDR